ncbi:MAG: hypothetical protein K0R22_58 [Sporomusa sp.]|jgi:hypothetical protein|nr:hypothetical protein [Sporomusa sp.]
MADTKTYTTNYNLEKPGQDDFYNVDIVNANADKTDAELKAAADRDTAHKSALVLDHPAGSVTDAHIGNRTITDTVTAAAGANTITNLFSMVGNMIKRITGKTNWWTPPATTLEAANTHITATSGAHSATNANTANAIVQRDASGNFIANTITAALNGLAATATKLATARTIAISGKVTGTATSFDGSGNIVIPVTAVTADICTGNSATATTAAKLTTARIVSLTGDVTGSTSFDGSGNVSIATTNTAAMPVGFTFPLLANSPLPGSLALQGALVTRAAYPDLWAWIQANAPLITESAWQAQAAVQTSVGAYSSGDGSTNFRLPKIVDFVRGSDTGRTPGTWQADAMQGHWHDVQQGSASGGTKVGDNPVDSDNKNVNDSGGAILYNRAESATTIRTDLVNGTGEPRIADETRSKSISMLWCVKAFGATTNQGVVDITALAASLNDKIGKTDIGYGTQVWVSGEYTPVVNTPTIVSHGLNITPLKTYGDVLLKCVVAEAGYSVGDYAISFVEWCGSAVEYAPKPVVTATTIQQNTGSYGLFAINKASGTPVQLVPANWRYVFRIRY